MKFSSTMKTVWWAFVTLVLTITLMLRSPDIAAGSSTQVDMAIAVVWLGLLIAPLFEQVSLFGLTMKREIEKLREAMSGQITELRSEVRNAVEVRATVSPQFHFTPPPPADYQLPDIEGRIQSAVAAEFARHGSSATSSVVSTLAVPNEVSILFSARYHLERELRQLAQRRNLDLESKSFIRRPPGVLRLLEALQSAELIAPQTASGIREVYSVCSTAVHGEPVTDAKVQFVRDVAPELVTLLRAIP